MKNINLPTKITISRIILATLLIIFVILMYILDQFEVINVAKTFNIYLTNSTFESVVVGPNYTGPKINGLNLIVFGIFLIASLTDFVDGCLARKLDQVTDLGKFLDPIADKMLVNSMMIFLSLNFITLADNVKLPFFCVIIMIVRDLVVDGLRFMAAQKNVVIAANIYGKLKTATQMIAICIVFLNGFPFNYFDYNWPTYLHISDWLCYIATFFSVLSGVIYVKQNINVLGGKTNE